MPINTRARPRLRKKPRPNPKFRGGADKIRWASAQAAGRRKANQL